MLSEEHLDDKIHDEVKVDASRKDGRERHAKEVGCGHLVLYFVFLKESGTHLILDVLDPLLHVLPDLV